MNVLPIRAGHHSALGDIPFIPSSLGQCPLVVVLARPATHCLEQGLPDLTSLQTCHLTSNFASSVCALSDPAYLLQCCPICASSFYSPLIWAWGHINICFEIKEMPHSLLVDQGKCNL